MTMFEMDGEKLVAFAENPSDLSLDDPAGIQQALADIGRAQSQQPMSFSGFYLSLLYGGIDAQQLNPEYGDPTLPRTPRQYLDEAMAAGNLTFLPPADLAHPELIFNLFGNPSRHCRMGDSRTRTLFGKAKLVVNITIRMDETTRQSDILLPAASSYEKVGFKYATAYPPYLHMSDRSVAPAGESRSEWEIFSMLAERVSAVASQRGVTEVRGYRGVPYDPRRTAERFSDRGRLGPGDEEKVAALTLALSHATRGITLQALRRNKGVMRYVGTSPLGSGKMWCGTSDYRPDEPLVAFQDMVVAKRPWPTSTGRQQFYSDHPLFLEVGEELPVHKEPPRAGGNYPLTLTGGHTRWSIHTTWRDVDILLRLQRGEPVLFVNSDDAHARGIRDHDYVAAFNDLGEFVARAMVTQAMRPGQAHIYHAWGSHQFLTGKSNDSISPSPLKVTRLVGRYGHLVQGGTFEPTQNDRDTRVELRRYQP
jgi:anaerobic selenocysteine-containing dehydrogenase